MILLLGACFACFLAGAFAEALLGSRPRAALPPPAEDPFEPWQVETGQAIVRQKVYDYDRSEYSYQLDPVSREWAVRLRAGDRVMPLYTLNVADEDFADQLDARIADAEARADKLNRAIGRTM